MLVFKLVKFLVSIFIRYLNLSVQLEYDTSWHSYVGELNADENFLSINYIKFSVHELHTDGSTP